MTTRTAEEAKRNYIEKMGEELGTQFYALWLEVDWLHATWGEYVHLFSEPKSVEILNQTAPALFRIFHAALWEQTLLRIARLTDPPKAMKNRNLTIQNLPELVDPTIKGAVQELVDAALNKCKFCRDWRNRQIAHSDLNLLMNGSAKPLEVASGIRVQDALGAIASVLNEPHLHYMDSWLVFSGNVGGAGNALSLLRLLHDGLRARAGKTLGEYPV
ncbi:hypothetical protein QEV83_17840 [Methylocapsa sp. D3K7]|uniref:AbiU2 domain-containing protein n=1 Tax=Methylocapsa sp. D3K7 TaxID=3041435 RepID=UPI00244EEE61|nr:hypothetical protein [Methylocapsa sp. D3K7]WGJ14464.1 hypothetical protein QEV83_17840 [Methylocapsa sp. D3K7]